MAIRLLLDTDVVIDYLRDQADAVEYLENRPEELLISSIAVAELYSGVRDESEREALETFLKAFEIVPVDREIDEMITPSFCCPDVNAPTIGIAAILR